jgi:hypothetical protein
MRESEPMIPEAHWTSAVAAEPVVAPNRAFVRSHTTDSDKTERRRVSAKNSVSRT